MLFTILIIQVALSIAILISLIQVKKALFQTQKAMSEISSNLDNKQAYQIESSSIEEIEKAVHIDWSDETEYWAEVNDKRPVQG